MSIGQHKFNVGEVLFLILVLIVSLVFTAVTATAGVVSAHFAAVSGNNQNEEYTYPYYVSIDGRQSFAMMCDDFYHASAVGDTWLGNVTPASSADLSNTRFGDYTEYAEAAFLLRQMTDANTVEWGNINWAVWEIFSPSVMPGAGLVGTLGPAYWYDLARSVDPSTVNVSGLEILTPVDAHSSYGDQEFLFITPEPGALLLFGTGLLAVWSQRKRCS